MGRFVDRSRKLMIRLSLRGCTNRPFYHIVVQKNRTPRDKNILDQVGTYDPMVNKFGERLVAVNFDKLRHWLGLTAQCSVPVLKLLGLAGFYPVHPRTRLEAHRKQKEMEEEKKRTETEAQASDT
ncbi:28S ribosomal protein S16, mitochondrial-like [Mya arenaria]|uniref:28S ribosomal protein S16, mitochondrial-like n=1 Tax=Mya arenaria TaxID=6604 RepID=UPI0022E5B4FE|nr:28S ribosomal protein S16, mitochondrial-like [Mya arenaria]